MSSSSRNEMGDRVRAVASRDEPRGEDCAASQPGANVTVPGLPCGRTGEGRADDAARPAPRKPPGREGPGKQTSHQLTWKVNRPGGRRPLEAGWARERCGSRPSLSSRLGESTGQARRHGFETRWHGQLCEIRVLGSPPISVDHGCNGDMRVSLSLAPIGAGCRSGNQAPDQVHVLRTRVQIALLQPFTGRLGIGEPKAL
jgi:hypothetical protein